MQVLPVCVSGVWGETYSRRLRAAFFKNRRVSKCQRVHGGSPSCQEANRSQLILPRREPRGLSSQRLVWLSATILER